MELTKAYEMVLTDMVENGAAMFQGSYDAKNGKKDFMYGIWTVMEFIADCANNKDFDNLFIENLKKSEENA